MLAVPWPSPFNDPAWAYELKWDGIRALLTYDGTAVRVRSRRGVDLTDEFPEFQGWSPERPMVVDAEIVAFDDAGRPSFATLQARRREGAAVAAAVFDLLYDGGSQIDRPWVERRRGLEDEAWTEPFVLSHASVGDMGPLWQLAEARDLEGVVAKRVDAPYRPGVRSPDWRKIVRYAQVRAAVVGFTPGERGRTGSFGALLVALATPRGLRWVGGVGSGFTEAQLSAIRPALDAMVVPDPPVVPDENLPPDATWVAPTLVAMVRYRELTAAGRLRFPSFQGFTSDPPDAFPG